MKQTLIDHAKTIGCITGVILALAFVIYLMVTFEKYIIIAIIFAIGSYCVYSTYMAVYNEVKASRKRKEVENARRILS